MQDSGNTIMPNEHNNNDRTASANFMVGRDVLHYKIVNLIGGGGMGQVYLAQDTRLDRLVALKTLQTRLSSEATFRQRFVVEARAAARLSHPNICSPRNLRQIQTSPKIR